MARRRGLAERGELTPTDRDRMRARYDAGAYDALMDLLVALAAQATGELRHLLVMASYEVSLCGDLSGGSLARLLEPAEEN